MKKKKATKLKINRETMLSLENDRLHEANGGATSPCPTHNITCVTCCPHNSCV
jgi:hypothetical protein